MKVEYNAESQIFGGSILGDVYSSVSGQRFKDERHVPLITDKGVKLAEFAGPGTHIKYRIENNIKPLGAVDKSAKAHDIRYSLSQNVDDVRFADNKMISKLEEIDRKGLDYKINVKAVKTAMKAKRLFEDVGVWDKGSFSDMKGAELSDSDKRLFESELNKLVQEGFGIAIGIKGKGLGQLDFVNLGEKLFLQNPLQFKSLLDTSLDKIIVGNGLKESMARGIKRIIYGALPFLQWFDSDKTILQGRGLKQF
jgi:hypothetical protein